MGHILNDASRREEVQKLAQSVAASQFVSSGLPQQPQNGNFAPLDTAKISSEALEEVSRSHSPEQLQRTDQLVAALQEAWKLKAEQDPARAPQQAGEAAETQGAKKEKPKKAKYWKPLVSPGQIHTEGQEVIGKFVLKDEPNSVEKTRPTNAQTPLGGSGTQGNSSAAPDEDREEAARENAATAQSLKSFGLEAPRLEQGGAAGGGGSEEVDVHTRATGATQTVTVRPEGLMNGSPEPLRRFKRLDNSPLLKGVSLSPSENPEETAKAYAVAAAQRGERPEQINKTVEQLRKTTPDETGGQ